MAISDQSVGMLSYYCLLQTNTSPVSCRGLPLTWENIETTQTFPIPPDTEVTVTCQQGHTLIGGDTTVTCVREDQFLFGSAPPLCSIGWV